ncbi:MAG: response regulator [Bacteroidia bacterium]
MPDKKVINILLADDDHDDRYFFAKALKSLPIPTKLVTVDDGEELMNYLTENKAKLPDILFLDINMPRKNGNECLIEIKGNKSINYFPVIMYSTSLKDTVAEMLFQNGAHYYLRKGDFSDLVKHLQLVLTMLQGKNFQRPSIEEFVLNEMRVT